jgi:calcium-binding protein CML
MKEPKVDLMRREDTMSPVRMNEVISMSAEDQSYFTEVFEMFDTDQSGAIDLKELQEAVVSTGMNPSETELRIMMASVTGSDKNEVSLTEFLKMVVIIKNQGGKDHELSLQEAFQVMDVDNNGYISASDMFKVLENINQTLPADQIYEMLAYGDDDFDGKVIFINNSKGQL